MHVYTIYSYINIYIITPATPDKHVFYVTQVLEHGLFIGVTSALLVASRDGVRRVGGGPGGEQPWW